MQADDCAGGMVAMRESEPLFVSNANVVRTKGELATMCEQMVALRTGTSQTMYMIMTTVWSRDTDGWQMVHLHESYRPLPE